MFYARSTHASRGSQGVGATAEPSEKGEAVWLGQFPAHTVMSLARDSHPVPFASPRSTGVDLRYSFIRSHCRELTQTIIGGKFQCQTAEERWMGSAGCARFLFARSTWHNSADVIFRKAECTELRESAMRTAQRLRAAHASLRRLDGRRRVFAQAGGRLSMRWGQGEKGKGQLWAKRT